MANSVVNLADKFGQITEPWKPRIAAQVNDYHVKIAKIRGEFVWHKHDETDEMFFVAKGQMTIRLRDGDVTVKAGEIYVVPRGVEHCPVADETCEIVMIEPAGTMNTGDAGGDRTVDPDWA